MTLCQHALAGCLYFDLYQEMGQKQQYFYFVASDTTREKSWKG
jgi:hypothetical protein